MNLRRLIYGLVFATSVTVVCGLEAGGEPVHELRPGNVGRWTKIRVYRTFYCATGPGCHEKICGGNRKTAWNRDATRGDGCAVDPRRIRYGSILRVNGNEYVADDTFGRAQRQRDWDAGIVHIDVRVASRTHEEVRRMGAGYIDIEVLIKE